MARYMRNSARKRKAVMQTPTTTSIRRTPLIKSFTPVNVRMGSSKLINEAVTDDRETRLLRHLMLAPETRDLTASACNALDAVGDMELIL
mmetsp:Transcript_127060/g.220147  ORF Transcript_127060/g.220147 Transcript_127060/m.220147 type:complete len:90 (+) Transcript_127060:317-586(+)